MSKKPAGKAKGGKGEGGTPLCVNKSEAKMVCLCDKCQEYPFFCSSCEDSSCEIPHQHSDKLTSVSYRELIKRVLKERKPINALGDAMNSYREVLQKLKEDVNEFIEKETAQLDQITKKAETVSAEDDEMIRKLKAHQYQGLTGAQMDKLWTSCAEDPEKTQAQEQTAEFIKIKEEEVKGISQHFEHLNHMDFDNMGEDKEKEDPKAKPKK